MTQESVPVGRRADTPGDRTAARLQAAPAGTVTPAGIPAPTPLRSARSTSGTVTWVAAGLAYALFAGSLRRLTIPAEITTLLPGAVLVWYALRPGTAHFPAPAPFARRATMPWIAIAVAFGIWETYAAARGSTHAHPTLSILMGPLIDPPLARAAGYAVWLLTGLWLVRR